MRETLSARFSDERICTAATLKEVAVSFSAALSVIGNESAAANEQETSATIFMAETNEPRAIKTHGGTSMRQRAGLGESIRKLGDPQILAAMSDPRACLVLLPQ